MPQNECQVGTSEHNAPSDDIMGFLLSLTAEEPTTVAANPPTLHNKTHNKTDGHPSPAGYSRRSLLEQVNEISALSAAPLAVERTNADMAADEPTTIPQAGLTPQKRKGRPALNLSPLEKRQRAERARMQNREQCRKQREKTKQKLALVPAFETRLAVLEEQIAEAAASLQKKDSELAHEKAQVRQLEVKVQQLEAQVREEQKAKKAKSLS
jgi:hypothetical protein